LTIYLFQGEISLVRILLAEKQQNFEPKKIVVFVTKVNVTDKNHILRLISFDE